jgi:malonate transporter and related proteins
MSHLLASIWPLFVLILGGYLARRSGFPNEDFWPGAERFNYFILFPALLIKSLVAAPLDNPALPSLALCAALVLVTLWIVLMVLRRVFRWQPARFGVLVQGTLRFNTYIGLAIAGSAFGPAGLTLAALLLAIIVPIVNVLSVFAFTAGASVTPRALALTVMKNPLIVACLLGVSANLAGVRFAGGSDELFSFLAATSLPLGLLCVGAALHFEELRGETKAMLLSSIGRLLVVPCLAYAFAQMAGLAKVETALLVLFLSLPCAPTAYILARQLGGDARLMAGIITLQTLLSAVTLPLVLQAVL